MFMSGDDDVDGGDVHQDVAADLLQAAASEAESRGKQGKGCRRRLKGGCVRNYHPLPLNCHRQSFIRPSLKIPIDTAAGEKRNVYLRGRLPREWAAADYNPLTQGVAGWHSQGD